MLYKIEKMVKNKSVIFVDFFDTIMFRQIHSHQLLHQWEKALIKKYSTLSEINLSELRKKVIKRMNMDECAISYQALLTEIYKDMKKQCDFKVGINEFINVSYKVDYCLDMATQYPNKLIIDFLYKMKKDGKKIYLLSDYYLPGKCYKHYLKPYRLEGLFDDIFCSSDYGMTKADGDLYRKIISVLDIDVENVIMIGDSKRSDVDNAIKAGILGIRYFPVIHKIKTNIRKRINYSFEKNIDRSLYNNCFKNTLFGEYALNLYYFTKKLRLEIEKTNCDTAYFLARGGYFLKECFDAINDFLPKNQRIHTKYLKNSRKVNRLALQNKHDKEMLEKYLFDNISGRELCLIDEGWYCTSQIAIEQLYGYKIKGFYIGIMGRNPEDIGYSRKGILFDADENGGCSPLYGVFRTNCTFYEQLLSAPHGSASKYVYSENGIEVREIWQDVEKDNYYRNIKPMQEMIIDYCMGLEVWNSQLSIYQLAKFVLKTSMFGSKERLRLLKEIDSSWYDNANDTSEKNITSIKNIKISITQLILNPEMYLRYFCKLKELKLDYPFMKIAYPLLGSLIYLYCKLSIVRYRKIKGINDD